MSNDADDASLVQFVATRDAPCPVCSYNLRGLQAAKCPECSAPLHLQVGSENLKLGAWFVSCTSCALALGFDGVVATVMTVALIRHPPPSRGTLLPVLIVYTGFLVLAAASGTVLALLFKRRSRFLRQDRARQWQVAWAIFGVVFVVHALFGGVLASRM